MPSKTHEIYQRRIRKWFRDHAHEADVPPQLDRHAKAALILWNLDLGEARPILERGYANNPRGGDPWDSVVILRLLLLSCLVGQPSINRWVDDLTASRVLRALGGLDPEDGRRPGVGTFCDFLHRLHDGPIRRSCSQIERPSENERRRAQSPRTLKRRKPKRERKKARPKRGPEKESEGVFRSVTAKLVAELEATANQDLPDNLLTRLAQVLIDVAVMESAERGLLGDIDRLAIGSDGSKLPTGANPHGKRICDHEPGQRCDCPKMFSDPDAEWGYDSTNSFGCPRG